MIAANIDLIGAQHGPGSALAACFLVAAAFLRHSSGPRARAPFLAPGAGAWLVRLSGAGVGRGTGRPIGPAHAAPAAAVSAACRPLCSVHDCNTVHQRPRAASLAQGRRPCLPPFRAIATRIMTASFRDLVVLSHLFAHCLAHTHSLCWLSAPHALGSHSRAVCCLLCLGCPLWWSFARDMICSGARALAALAGPRSAPMDSANAPARKEYEIRKSRKK